MATLTNGIIMINATLTLSGNLNFKNIYLLSVRLYVGFDHFTYIFGKGIFLSLSTVWNLFSIDLLTNTNLHREKKTIHWIF